eukprot:Phypoly_transcript_10140.p1 GENE.Phypoly_transcript_10140~~Phypoly_transcript_10140.p1  ORF type:complete len:416 (+),score=24.60 Phypoly_transcript_10140:40-1287(+)
MAHTFAKLAFCLALVQLCYSLNITNTLTFCATSPSCLHRTDTFCPHSPIKFGDLIELGLEGYDNDTYGWDNNWNHSEVYATVNGHDFRDCHWVRRSHYGHFISYKLLCTSTERQPWYLAGLSFTVHLTMGCETASARHDIINYRPRNAVGLNDGRLIIQGSCLVSPHYQTLDVWGHGCPGAYVPAGSTNIFVCQFTRELLALWGYNFTIQERPNATINFNGFQIDASYNPIFSGFNPYPLHVDNDVYIVDSNNTFPDDLVLDNDDNIFYSPSEPPPTVVPTCTNGYMRTLDGVQYQVCKKGKWGVKRPCQNYCAHADTQVATSSSHPAPLTLQYLLRNEPLRDQNRLPELRCLRTLWAYRNLLRPHLRRADPPPVDKRELFVCLSPNYRSHFLTHFLTHFRAYFCKPCLSSQQKT